MADVYENACVTIAASAARDSEEGYFRKTHWSCMGHPLPEHPGVFIRRRPENRSESGSTQ